MSDDTPSPRHAARRLPKRQDWLPNRMFDSVNNPFAIQNLLAREREKEDALFHVDVAGNPGATYSGNPLLKEREILPSKEFALNRLLEETTRFDHGFHAEYDDLDDENDSEQPDSDPHDERTVAAPAVVAGITDTASHHLAGALEMAAADASTADPSTDKLGSSAEQLLSSNQIADPRAEREFTADLAAADIADAVAETESEPSVDSSAQDSSRLDEPLAATDVAHADTVAEIPPSPDWPPQDAQIEQASAQADTENLHAGTVTEAPPADSTLGVAEDTASDARDVAPSSPASATITADAARLEGTASKTDNENETPAGSHQELSEYSDASHALASSDASHLLEADPGSAQSSVAVVANDTETAEKPPGLSSEVMSSMLEAAREEAREAAYQEGLQVGRDQAMTELQQSFDEKITHLNHILEGLQRLSEDPDTLFEPMKKLAVHLAEQLVRGELSQSPQTISRLVDNCLRELAASGEKAVIVHLNPEDLEQYKPLIAPFGDSILLRPDATLTRGSVRASLDGSVVEDLIERRVKGIQKSLAQPVAGSWRPALPNPLVQRAQPQSPTPVSKSPVVEEAADTAEDVFSADDDLTDTVLTQSDAAAEPIDTVGASDTATQGVHGDVEPGATP